MDDRTRGFEEEGLAQFIASQIYGRASGRDATECILNFPHDQYFIGNLRPAPQIDEASSSTWVSELLDKLAPVAFGAEFRIQPKSHQFTIQVRLRWSCYYRVFPTFAQQLEHQRKPNNEDGETEKIEHIEEKIPIVSQTIETDDEHLENNESPELIETAKDRRKGRTPTDTLYIRFKKIPCEATGIIHIRLNGLGDAAEWDADATDLQNAADSETKRAQERALADPENLRTNGRQNDSVRIPETALADPQSKGYIDFCKQLATLVVPEWKWQIKIEPPRLSELVDNPSERLLMVEFTNATPMSEKSPNVEPFLFEIEAGFNFADCFPQPLKFDLAPRGFRYDPNTPARGFNCNIIEATKVENVQFISTNMPCFRQRRYQTQSRPAAHFEDLAQEPIPVLKTILEHMQKYLEEWDRQAAEYAAQEWWNVAYQNEYEHDRQAFQREIQNFAEGLELICNNSDVQLAFKLTNEVFRRGDPRKKTWRLFQIVFLISQIPGIAALADPTDAGLTEREMVDIIYFPTGGGKTEAYLSVITFHCFFDRLRGKKGGVTAWTRFPLRLLTLQQTQRVADVIGLAEIVRKEQTAEPRLTSKDVSRFAVGYFVGSGATPNKLSPPYGGGYPSPEWIIANDPDDRQQWKRIVRCPSCGTNTIVVDFNEKSARLLHRCTQLNCKFEGGYLPVYVVDNEVYRYLPSVVVGTIDKLAGIGNQHKMSLILGRQVEGYCKQHGYYSGKCSQDECTDQTLLVRRIPQGLSGPTMFVQDELHLLKEGLGTFDAHYETFVQRLMKEYGQNHTLKVIASSATIEAFPRQVEHLYGRDPNNARVFPGLGPTQQASFYAETLDYPQRLFLGIIPHNKTIFNAILELVQYYHEIVQDLQRMSSSEPNPYNGEIMPGTQDWRELLDFYTTSMTYFLNTRFLHSIKTDLEADVNPDLERRGYRALSISELTGSVSTRDVAKTLERMEHHLPPPKEILDTILATNMVSHGVDIDRLNAMLFYGMPAQVAEYLQSSSRVGRSHVGLVFMCLHPVHERDQSHYAYFSKFHEFLGQLIEPVAINRWSRFSVQRTLPGLCMAILLQLISNRSGEKSPGRYTRLDFVKKQIRDGKIRSEGFIPFLEEAYQVVGVDTPGAKAFRQEIQLRVEQFFDQILGAVPPTEWVSEALIPPPMTSLRDVDEQLVVELDDMGSNWARRK